jgi:hypothetical protein
MALATVVCAASLSFGGVANAAPPSNDDAAGATVVTTLPSTYSQDTTQATTSAAESAINSSFCGAPTLSNGVWYTYTATADTFVGVDVSTSSFSAGIFAQTGTGGTFVPQTCAPGQATVLVAAGETLQLLLFGDGLSAATSGTLNVTIRPAVAPPDLLLTIDKTASVNKLGVAHFTGTTTCTSSDGSGQVLEVFGQVRQTVGRIFIDGFFDVGLSSPCDGAPHAWGADVAGQNGLFSGGKAASVALGFACTDLCSTSYAERTVQLRKNGK